MRGFALVILVSAFYCHVCEEMPIHNKTQVACQQLRASSCSRAIGLDLRCAPEELKVPARSKAPRPRSLKDALLTVRGSKGSSLVKIDNKRKKDAIKKKLRLQSAARLGYRSFKAGKFKMNIKKHNTKLSWDAALAVCESEGGSLVKIDTKLKEDAIKEKIKIKSSWGRPAYLWLGLRYYKEMKSFAWTDKTPLGYTDWGTGEPSHSYREMSGRVVKEDCVALSGSMFLGNYWNDRTCSKVNGFICEIF
ncbi:C-type mannose receptor 2-like [Haliotis cracherodii]|uniref:C-type mannose receptor 2-like n=1 Tax=Haliotis cracherodii TaxID=6455 RepID=UPI0039EAE40C